MGAKLASSMGLTDDTFTRLVQQIKHISDNIMARGGQVRCMSTDLLHSCMHPFKCCASGCLCLITASQCPLAHHAAAAPRSPHGGRSLVTVFPAVGQQGVMDTGNGSFTPFVVLLGGPGSQARGAWALCILPICCMHMLDMLHVNDHGVPVFLGLSYSWRTACCSW